MSNDSLNFGDKFGLRLVFASAALIGGGPVLAAIVWKGVGFATSGNPLHLIPGGGVFADGMSLAADVATSGVGDLADAFDAAGGIKTTGVNPDSFVEDPPENILPSSSYPQPGVYTQTIQGGPEGVNGHGHVPTDIHGKPNGTDIYGHPPRNGWGTPTL